MDEEMGHLVDEFEGFAVLEHDLFLLVLLLLVLLPFPLFISLPLVDLKLLTFRVLTQLQQKLSLLLQELKQLDVMALDIQRRGIGSRQLSLIDLLDQGIDGLTGLNGDILVLFKQEVIQLVEEVDVVLGGDQVPLQDLQHQDLILGGGLIFAQSVDDVPDHLLLEIQEVW